jgi:hypothetical protein
LPLELREQIYGYVFDDLVVEPRHPYSDFPLNSRFEDYLALLLVDKATSDEAKTVFRKGYEDKIVFYFEDACSLYDLHRRWEESASFSFETRFVLRTRTDLDPSFELDDGIQWMNEVFFYNSAHGTEESDLGNVSLNGLSQHGDEILDLYGQIPGPEFQITHSDHTQCCQKERCIPYKHVRFPPLKGSL